MMSHVSRLVLLLLLIHALVNAQIGTIPSGGAAGGGGAVGGASNLTTVGAIPYVSASGVLGQVSGFTLTPTGGGGRVIETGSDGTTVTNIRGGSGTTALRFGASTSYSFAITSSGNHLFGTTPSSDGGYKLGVQSSGTTGTVRIFDQTATTGSTLAVIQAGAGQSGSLLSVRNNAGTEVAGFGSTYWNLFASGTTDNLFGASLSGNFAYLGGNSTAITLFLLNSTPLKWSPNGATGSTDLGLARNAAGVMEINNGTAGTYRDLLLRRSQHNGVTVASLPAAAAGNAGSIQYVTDANATTIGSTVAGGGANKVMVWSDGTNWKIYAN